MMLKKMVLVFATAMCLAAVARAEATVSDVTAKQRYPWNGLVDISCKVSGIGETSIGQSFVLTAINKDSGNEYPITTYSVIQGSGGVSGWDVCADGTYKILWDARTDIGQVVFDNLVVRVILKEAALSEGKVQLWAGGPYWADRNLGASSPWDYGLYFWWGDTTGHKPTGGTFSFNFSSGNAPTYSKSYSELQSEGWITSSGVLALSHDAAHKKWGGSWRMPTDAELNNLRNKCIWTWTSLHGVNGYVVRGQGAYAQNSIFLPAAGYGYGTSLYGAGSYGYYWSSVPTSDYGYGRAWSLDFYSGRRYTYYYDYRDLGQVVRPVQGFAN